LSDPDHLNASRIETLYLHWLTRQGKGLSPLLILNPGPLHTASGKKARKSQKGKGKQKKDYVEISSEIETDSEEVGEQDGGEKGGTPEEDLQQVAHELELEKDEDEEDEEEEEGKEEGEEGEGGCESDGGEEIPQVVKYGPPTRRGKPPTQFLSDIAGPSRLPPANHSQKGKKAKAAKAVDAGGKKGGKTEKSKVAVESHEFDDVGAKVSKSINAGRCCY